MTKYKPKSDLEKIFFDELEKETPARIKNNKLINLENLEPFTFTLQKEHLKEYSEQNPEGLGLSAWLENYESEAKFSTAGIRGPQNPLYPWDTRYPISLVGVMLATLGKGLLVQENCDVKKINKIAVSEVRYNSKLYVETIARVQAGMGINTYVADEYKSFPIWLVSFLIFMYDLYGGEYVTSSHAISKKMATKDLNYQGSQYIPEESIKFVENIKHVFAEVEEKGSYEIKFSAKNSPLVNKDFLKSINYGFELYLDYLGQGVLTETNLKYINSLQNKVVIDCVGGTMSWILDDLFSKLGVKDKFEFLHTEEDPFFHGIGKTVTEQGTFLDHSCDATVMNVNLATGTAHLPVVETVDYASHLKDLPIGTVLLITDPDGDRLVTASVQSVEDRKKAKSLGIVFLPLDEDKILCVFTPNQSFLLTFDFYTKNLKESGDWQEYDWFIIKTTASAQSWDQWAKANEVPVINTPVGFKEIATIMRKVENIMEKFPGREVVIQDVFGKEINLGKNPRLLFAGEESGGEIFGPKQIISSKKGKKAISMREKSAGEAIVISAAMIGWMNQKNLTTLDYLARVFDVNDINLRYDIRVDHKYYNENEPNIKTLNKEKTEGICVRTNNDNYFLCLTLGVRNNIINIKQVRDILREDFPELNFDDLEEVYFVGDGNYFVFGTKHIEVRPSGTDAVNKVYGLGEDWEECVKYAQEFSGFDGTRGNLHKQLIPQDFYNGVKDLALELLIKYQQKDLPESRYSL